MDPQELARQLAFLAASDDPEVRQQAQGILNSLQGYQNNPLVNTSPESFGAQVGQVLSGYGQFARRIGGKVAEVFSAIPARPVDTYAGAGLKDAVDSGLESIGTNALSGIQSVGDTLNPSGAAERLIAEQQAQINQGPLQGLGPDLQQQAASSAANQAIAGFVPGQGLGPDLQQQAAAYAANQAGALQGINQQAALVSQLQAGQLQSYVQQEELRRQSELLGLLQDPAVNPNALTNAAAFSQAPGVSTAPNNLTTLLPQQASLGSVDIASLLPAAQTNLKQRQRTATQQAPLINTSVQQQERALELARQQYIDDVSRKIMARTR